jgi:hypothetical protein
MQTALVEFEGELLRQSSSLPEGQRPEEQRPGEQSGLGLLSMSEVCEELGMGRSWVYRRLKASGVPSYELLAATHLRKE